MLNCAKKKVIRIRWSVSKSNLRPIGTCAYLLERIFHPLFHSSNNNLNQNVQLIHEHFDLNYYWINSCLSKSFKKTKKNDFDFFRAPKVLSLGKSFSVLKELLRPLRSLLSHLNITQCAFISCNKHFVKFKTN